MRHVAQFSLDDLTFWKKRLLHWAATHEVAAYLDSNRSPVATNPATPADATWDCLVGAGGTHILSCEAGSAFSQLQDFQDGEGIDWLFGFFAYDLKNEVERLSSAHSDGIGFPDMLFFQPETVLGIRNSQLEIRCLTQDPQAVYEALKCQPTPDAYSPESSHKLQPRFSKPDYLAAVETIRQHIIRGNVYEVNLCQEFFSENATLNPVAVFEQLNAIALAPFATFFRWHHRYLLSASPERFLKKTGDKVVSQPIKGTRRRGKTAEEDEQIRHELAASKKDRAENVMIVDLVRNDLARHCQPGSVQVDELFGIYTFPTVLQMISTVSGTLQRRSSGLVQVGADNETPNVPMTNLEMSSLLLRDAFPMGSMTGAPKVMAMQLIEQYERTRRGLYSGAVGYFDPAGDFDFNVVIRSILYNAESGYISVQVGGAIVFDSDPEQEYEECLLKAEAMLKALE